MAEKSDHFTDRREMKIKCDEGSAVVEGENLGIKSFFKLVFSPKKDLTVTFYYLNIALFVLI